MTTYINTETLEYPIYEGDIRAAFRHSTSFPATGFVPPPGYAAVDDVDPPEPTLEQSVRELPPNLVDGVWTQRWEVTQAPPELVAERVAAVRAAQVSAYVAALEAHYDAKARERRYDNRLTCALRAGYAGPFQAEGTAFAVWMDNCNAYAYTVLAQVEAAQRAMPADPAALIDELPQLVWP